MFGFIKDLASVADDVLETVVEMLPENPLAELMSDVADTVDDILEEVKP